jgi:cellulose synthase/poly-beta-1,6-N-acetylglucosamine synthase-like glycosyltransferase
VSKDLKVVEEFTASMFHFVKEIVSGDLCGLLFEEQLKPCSKKFYQIHLSLYIYIHVQYCYSYAHVLYSWIASFCFALTFILPSNNQDQADSKILGKISYKNPL